MFLNPAFKHLSYLYEYHNRIERGDTHTHPYSNYSSAIIRYVAKDPTDRRLELFTR